MAEEEDSEHDALHQMHLCSWHRLGVPFIAAAPYQEEVVVITV